MKWKSRPEKRLRKFTDAERIWLGGLRLAKIVNQIGERNGNLTMRDNVTETLNDLFQKIRN